MTRQAPMRSANAPPASRNTTRGRVIAVSTAPAKNPPHPAAVQIMANAMICEPSNDRLTPTSQIQYSRGMTVRCACVGLS